MKTGNSYNNNHSYSKKDNNKRTNAYIPSKIGTIEPIQRNSNTRVTDVLPDNRNRNIFLYTELENKTSSYELPNLIIEIIRSLEKELIANLPSDVMNEKYETCNYPTSYKTDETDDNYLDEDGGGIHPNKYKSYYKPTKPEIDFTRRIKITDLEYKAAALEQNITFKPTAKIETTNTLDKAIKDIRIILNKMSESKFDQQNTAIFDIMKSYFETETVDSSNNAINTNTNIQVFAKKLLDVVSVDTFFSFIYSKLYKEWTTTYPAIFNSILHDYIVDYNARIDDDFHYVDSNVDYDGYCKYIKNNDKRKAISLFVVNLIKLHVLPNDIIYMILNHFLDKSIEYIDAENRLNEVEEMSDNIYIITSNIYSVISNSTEWNNTILPKIMNISQMKMKQHVSISNRVLFKYMDIVDSL